MSLAVWRGSGVIVTKQLITSEYIIRRTLFDWNIPQEKIKEQKYVLPKTINALPGEVYEVVSDVSKYQEFIPYCVESFVNKRKALDNTPIEAGLRVGFRQYDEKFVCKVSCNNGSKGESEDYSVVADSISHNLFHLLYSKWTITPHPERPHSTQVTLLLRFKFKSRLYNSVSTIFAKSVTELVMKAFERRVFELRKLATTAGATTKNKI